MNLYLAGEPDSSDKSGCVFGHANSVTPNTLEGKFFLAKYLNTKKDIFTYLYIHLLNKVSIFILN